MIVWPENLDLEQGSFIFSRCPAGFTPFVASEVVRFFHSRRQTRSQTMGQQGAACDLLYVVQNAERAEEVKELLKFADNGIEIILFPSWDTIPYDRASPHPAIMASRMAALHQILHPPEKPSPRVVVTTANALVQRCPSPEFIRKSVYNLKTGQSLRMEDVVNWLEYQGYIRVATVREEGEYSVRGGLIDLFSAVNDIAVRLDFFGSQLEAIRSFDVQSQRTLKNIFQLQLLAGSEMSLTPESIQHFRNAYIQAFGLPSSSDVFYEAIKEGRRFAGMEQWLGFFHPKLSNLFDFVGQAPRLREPEVDTACFQRLESVDEYYQDRLSHLKLTGSQSGAPYKPAPANQLFLKKEELDELWHDAPLYTSSPFSPADGNANKVVDLAGRKSLNFSEESSRAGSHPLDHLADFIRTQHKQGQRSLICCWSEGSLERMKQMLREHRIVITPDVNTLEDALALPKGTTGITVLRLDHGFVVPSLSVIAEQDILGDRLVRRAHVRRKNKDVLTEASSLAPNDLVVHADHGIGRFLGLKTVIAAGAPHDCLEIEYALDTRLFLPVENIELLSRYGSADTELPLDKLGGVAWQARKSRLKNRIREMAAKLLEVAAKRQTQTAPSYIPPEGLFEEFCAGFPYVETDDQLRAIGDVLEDLGKGKPMDRLICGDVGFGKTEVALRAAYTCAMAGVQVAVVVPTTLLSRQHFKNFQGRFAKLPVRVAQLSRLVNAKDAKVVRKEVASGKIDIIIGTHALLAKSMDFAHLGLLIIDEEQHFGVAHKERLKEMKANVHVLTLSATPIPRTMQLALTGVRDLSIIAQPPIDRLAVRTFVTPLDALAVREAILREKLRGGQTFFVCPRVKDLDGMRDYLLEMLPDLRLAMAHGQMTPSQIEDVMSSFYDGGLDVLLSTNIVESGLDIPTANTIIVYRADRFGLSQLHQLRGRVGRSRQRAYALFLLPDHFMASETATQRLQVLQDLDELGAGFQIASHDLDLRGSGNLLGEEQSGHIKEVGFELYQQMLEEAVASLRDSDEQQDQDAGEWSPQISLAIPMLIPESYIPDLSMRMQLYRRLGKIEQQEDIEAFAAEMIDRFGPVPAEVENLLVVTMIRALCRRASIARLDAGPKGVVIAFRNNTFAAPDKLFRLVATERDRAKIRPDQTLLFLRQFKSEKARMQGSLDIVKELVELLG